MTPGGNVKKKQLTEHGSADEAWHVPEEFRSLLRTTSEAVISMDRRGAIISWNEGARRLFGYDAPEVLGRPLAILLPERYRDLLLRGIEWIEQANEVSLIGKTVEFYGLRRDGTEFPLEFAPATWRTSGGAFYSGIVRDISDRRRVERALRITETCPPQPARGPAAQFITSQQPGEKTEARILVVEDEDVVREVTQEILELDNFSVVAVASAGEASWMMEHFEGEIDLMLTDVLLPESNGWELARRLRTLHPRAKIVYTSGYSWEDLFQHRELEPDASFLQKPFSSNTLLSHVRRSLRGED